MIREYFINKHNIVFYQLVNDYFFMYDWRFKSWERIGDTKTFQIYDGYLERITQEECLIRIETFETVQELIS